MPARFLANCWRGNFTKCGCSSDSRLNLLLVEAGAGSGALAAQILDFVAHEFPQFYAALRYVAVERSVARRALVARTQSLQSHLDRGTVRDSFGNCLPKLPADVFSRMNCSMRCPSIESCAKELNCVELYVTSGPNGLCEARRPAFFGRASRIFQRTGNHASRRTAGGSESAGVPVDRRCRPNACSAVLC